MFHRSRFTRPGGQRFRCSWWQLRDRIFRYRQYPDSREE